MFKYLFKFKNKKTRTNSRYCSCVFTVDFEHVFNDSVYLLSSPPANIYLFKVNNENTRKRCEIYSKLTIKTPKKTSMTLFWCVYC